MLLLTDRLILRAPEPEDFPAFKAYFTSERAEFTGGSPDPILAWNRFCMTLGHRIMRGFGVHTIVERASGRPMGAAGPFFPEGWPEPEIAWQIWSASYEGKGYAHEAVLAARSHAVATLGWRRPVSLIAPQNHRSRALAHRLGCQHEKNFVHPHFGALEIWRHPPPC